MSEKELERKLPKHLNFKYKLAVKNLVVNKASYDDVCLGCGINSEEEILLLDSLLSSFDYQTPAHQ